MKYYKVVTRDLYSSQVSSYGDPRVRVQYKLNDWVEGPNDTRLFVFSDLNEAKNFAISCNDRIFECKCLGVVKYNPCSTLRKISEYWNFINSILKKKKSLQKIKNPEFIDDSYQSCCLAKKVKLIKEL